jgi:hypothetical protein
VKPIFVFPEPKALETPKLVVIAMKEIAIYARMANAL